MSPLLVVILSAFFAGAVAIGVTVAIEKWGGVVGGFLGTLPTTIIPAAVGMRMNLGSDAAFADAMLAAPAGMLLNAGFLFLWRALPGRLPGGSLGVRLAVMVIASLSAWLASAVALVATIQVLRRGGLSMTAFGVAVTAAIATVGVLACLRPMPAPAGTRRVGPGMLLARGVLAAAAIGVSVWVASLGGTLSAGVASVFPAIFLTTMVALWVAQGEAVPAGAVGPMMLGSTSVAVYALVASESLPSLGHALGSLFAWLVAATCVTLPATLWLSWLRRRQVSEAVQ